MIWMCLLQWRLLNDGTKIAKYRETVNMAIEITFNVPFDGLRTLRRAYCEQ